MPRERLDDRLHEIWSRRLGLVVAPAGSGKTTLLAHFAATASAVAPVAWYRPETWDGAADVFLAYLEATLRGALGDGLTGGWVSVEDAARALESWPGTSALLVIDDLHVIEGTPAEAALERLLDYAPALRLLAASRTQPRFNLPRQRVSGDLLEIAGDDLRFRSWEVERLFHDFYREPLPPAEMAALARRTEGWAAGLQLFHLATRDKAPEDRRRVLEELSTGSRFVREYLTRNVLAELPPELRGFLVQTCVLQRLSGPICDALLSGVGSQATLAELERRQVFTQALDDAGHYRYHEVLRAHLESILVHDLGEAAVSERYARAAEVLEAAGAPAEALHAHCRAGNWAAVSRLCGHCGERLLRGAQVWIDSLPPAVLEHDPWLLLASARRYRADGLWDAALAEYQRAEQASGASEAAETAHRERQALAAWLQPGPAPAADLLGALRVATQRVPMANADKSLGPGAAEVVAGLCALLAGDLGPAVRLLTDAATSACVTGSLAVGARLGLGLASLLAGDPRGALELDCAIEAADAQGLGFLTRIGHACQALVAGNFELAQTARITCARLGDELGVALTGLLEGWARAHSEEEQALATAPSLLTDVAATLSDIEVTVLLAWAHALRAFALARMGSPDAVASALMAQRLAQSRALVGAALIADAALATADTTRRAEHLALLAMKRASTGLSERWAPVAPVRPPVEMVLFGGFRVLVEGTPLDLSHLKPRARALLRLLALQCGRPLHREAIQAALWPEVPPGAAGRNLHVTLSCLRQALQLGAGRETRSLLVRDGDAYRLEVATEVSIDLADFEADVAAAKHARRTGQQDRAIELCHSALNRCTGELLPEDGAADWAVEARERCRTAAAEVAEWLAELHLGRGAAREAARAAAGGLGIDRYHDPLWRLLVSAREQAGDRVAASRARAGYAKVMFELGVSPSGLV